MTEEAIENVKTQEAVAPETADQSQQVAPPEKSKEFNFRKMEDKNRRLEEELMALRREIEESRKPKEEVQEDISYQDDDLVTYANVNKLAEEKARKIIQEELAKKEKAALPAATRAKFNDYDEVMTTENIELLIQEDPDLEYDIKVAKNPCLRAYKAIKASSFYNKAKASRNLDNRIAENNQKPVSSNSLGSPSPLSQANDYMYGSNDLYEEMQKYRGGSL